MRRHETPADEGLEDSCASDTDDDPQDLVAASQHHQHLRAVLAALDPLPRQLLSLAFFRGCTHEEIATQTGIALGTVKSQIRRMLTALRSQLTPLIELAPGVRARWLYRSHQPNALRPSEPVALALLELAPGASLTAGLGLAGQGSEWLVVRGECRLDGVALAALDQHCRAAAPTEPVLSSARGATIYLRNSGDAALRAGTSRERDAVWEDFGPGIRRRVVWRRGNETCYLARAEAGAFVPAHGHHLDEECLMLEGELFLGDILLRAGEFQLAPAGLEHGIVQAASETLLYVRRDNVPAVDLLS